MNYLEGVRVLPGGHARLSDSKAGVTDSSEQADPRQAHGAPHSRATIHYALGEDVAATIGLTLALLALGATMLVGDPFFDALGSLAIGILLLPVAVFIGIEVKALWRAEC